MSWTSPTVACSRRPWPRSLRCSARSSPRPRRRRAPCGDERREAARALRAILPRVVGIAANFHDAEAPQILGPDTLPLDGATRAQDRIGATYHLASFGSFVQAHREQAARVHKMIV